MKPDKGINCVFEIEGRPCKEHPNVTFQGIICPDHLGTIFGLSSGGIFSDQSRSRETMGPMLHVKSGVVFQQYEVIFPYRDFFDKAVGYKDAPAEDADADNYRLSQPMQSFFSRLSSVRSQANIFQIEILRNLFVVDPITNVQLSLKSDDTRISLRTQVQHRLNQLRTHILNQPWYKHYVKDEISVSVLGDESEEVTADKLSAFEAFLLFNMFSDVMKKNGVEIIRLNAHLVYDPEKGFVVVQTMVHPLWLVYCGLSKHTQFYSQSKIKSDEYKHAPTKFIDPTNMADKRNMNHLLDSKCI